MVDIMPYFGSFEVNNQPNAIGCKLIQVKINVKEFFCFSESDLEVEHQGCTFSIFFKFVPFMLVFLGEQVSTMPILCAQV